MVVQYNCITMSSVFDPLNDLQLVSPSILLFLSHIVEHAHLHFVEISYAVDFFLLRWRRQPLSKFCKLSLNFLYYLIGFRVRLKYFRLGAVAIVNQLIIACS
jgi:hypothetical protein